MIGPLLTYLTRLRLRRMYKARRLELGRALMNRRKK
jgi:hypothetical protein